MKRVLNQLIAIIFFVISLGILFLNFFFNYLEYNKKNNMSNYNHYALVLGIGIFIIIFIVSLNLRQIKKNIYYIFLRHYRQ